MKTIKVREKINLNTPDIKVYLYDADVLDDGFIVHGLTHYTTNDDIRYYNTDYNIVDARLDYKVGNISKFIVSRIYNKYEFEKKYVMTAKSIRKEKIKKLNTL